MITAWMFYALVVGSFVGAGALALERLLRAHRRPVRMIWAGAMLLSVALPLGQIFLDLLPGGAGNVSVRCPSV